MAYNQGPQRPFDGGQMPRRPVPERQYPSQGSQNYPQQGRGGGGGYDQQYAQDDYGYDQGGGYAPQQQDYNQGYQQQQPPRGRGTPGPQGGPGPRGYPPQQQQGQYGDYPARGGANGGYGPRGGDPRAPAPGRVRPQDPYAQQAQQGRPPPRGESRGGYGAPATNGPPPRGDSRGYPNGGVPPAQGMDHGGRPPMGRAPNSVPDINADADTRTRSMDSQYAPRTFSLGSGPNSNVRGTSPGYNGGHPQQQQRQQQAYQEPASGRPDGGYAADGYSENIATSGPPLPAALLPAAGNYGAPQQPQQPIGQGNQGYSNGYAEDAYNAAPHTRGHKKEDSVGDVYDAYFGDDDGTQAPIPVETRSVSADRSGAGKQSELFFERRSVTGPTSQSHYDANYQEFDARPHSSAQAPLIPPKIAIYDGTRSASAAPNMYEQGFQGNANGWDQSQSQNGYGAPPQQRGLPQQQGGYQAQDQYDPGQAGFAPPQRSMTALDPAMGGFGPPQRSMTALDPAMGGFGPPQRSMTSQDVTMGGRSLPPRSATASISSISKAPVMGLPAHPAPYRPGLQQLPNGNNMPMTNKPPPVRNYQGGVIDAPQRISTPQPPPAPSGPAAQKKDPPVTSVTPQEIDQLRMMINSNPNDQASTLLLARKLVLASETLVASIPDTKQRTKSREKWIMEAHKLLKKLVAMNNTEAMFYLADCYGRGALGLETSPAQAFSLYQSAAKAGHAAAAYRTAVCCEIGQDDGGGTRKDPLKAMQWYKRAATLGDTPAMYKMGMIQLKGLLGQPINPREAVMWLKRAAERADAENPHALHELALLYSAPQSGEGSVMRDEGYSLELFRQAAELGYKFSQFKMGCAFEFGLFGLTINPKESIQWYSKAAVQEEHQSELALSGWYLTGAKDDRTQGVILAQSDTEAYLWARKAAVAGLAKAEYAMGYFTETGIGCVRDLDGAKRWYWRAAAQNFPKARERLEELKRNGGRDQGNQAAHHQRISRSKVNKNSEAECLVM